MDPTNAAAMRRKAFSQLRDAANLLTSAFGLLAESEIAVDQQPSSRVDEPRAAPTRTHTDPDEGDTRPNATAPQVGDGDDDMQDIVLADLAAKRRQKQKPAATKKLAPRTGDEMDVEPSNEQASERVALKQPRKRQSASKKSVRDEDEEGDTIAHPEKSTSEGMQTSNEADGAGTKKKPAAKKTRETKTPETAPAKGKRPAKTAGKKPAKKPTPAKATDAAGPVKSASQTKRAPRKTASKKSATTETDDPVDPEETVVTSNAAAEKGALTKSSSQAKRTTKKTAAAKKATMADKVFGRDDDEAAPDAETTPEVAKSKKTAKKPSAKKTTPVPTSETNEEDANDDTVGLVKSSTQAKRTAKKRPSVFDRPTPGNTEGKSAVDETTGTAKPRKSAARRLLAPSPPSKLAKGNSEDAGKTGSTKPSKADAASNSILKTLATPPAANANGKPNEDDESDSEFEDVSVDAAGSVSEGDSYADEDDDEAAKERAAERKKDADELDEVIAKVTARKDNEAEKGTKSDEKGEEAENEHMEDSEKENVEDEPTKAKQGRKTTASKAKTATAGKKRKAVDSGNVPATPIRGRKRRITTAISDEVDRIVVDTIQNHDDDKRVLTKKKICELAKSQKSEFSLNEVNRSLTRLIANGTVKDLGRSKGFAVQ